MRFVWKLSDLQIVRLHLFSLHLSLERYQNWPRLLVPWGWNLQTNHTQVSPAIVSEMMQLVPSTGSHGRWFQALQSSGWTSEATIISLRIALLLGRWWGCGYKVPSFSRRRGRVTGDTIRDNYSISLYMFELFFRYWVENIALSEGLQGLAALCAWLMVESDLSPRLTWADAMIEPFWWHEARCLCRLRVINPGNPWYVGLTSQK